MRIENHLLWDDADDVRHDLQDRPSWASGMVPRIIVIHYGVTSNIDALVAAQKHQGFFAHLSIDGFVDGTRSEYEVVQMLPFNVRGTHAGKSSYKGAVSCNGFAIGIEIANPGPLVMSGDEDEWRLKTTYGQDWSMDDAIAARHDHVPSPPSWTHWAKYSDQEIDLCVHICGLLKRAYPTIETVVGHDEIAPGRKFDPGPAFPMKWLRERTFP